MYNKGKAANYNAASLMSKENYTESHQQDNETQAC